MSSTKTKTSGGSSFCGMLTILFIALKLTGHVQWSWFWVLSPIWIPICFVLGVLVLVLGYFFISRLHRGIKRKKKAEQIVRAREEAGNATAHGLGLDSDRENVNNLLTNLRNRD